MLIVVVESRSSEPFCLESRAGLSGGPGEGDNAGLTRARMRSAVDQNLNAEYFCRGQQEDKAAVWLESLLHSVCVCEGGGGVGVKV